MRYSQAEKLEIIRLVEGSERSVRQTLDELGVPRSTFYVWYKRYQDEGYGGLANRQSLPGVVWNRIPDNIRGHVVEVALDVCTKPISCFIPSRAILLQGLHHNPVKVATN